MLDLNYIRSRRESLGLSLADATKLAGWGSRANWCDIENGRNDNPTLRKLVEMSKVLQCKVGKLIK